MQQDILTDVLTQPLAVDPSYIHSYWMMLHNFIEGKAHSNTSDLSEARAQNKMYAVNLASSIVVDRWTNLDEAPQNSVAIISLNGPVVKNSQFCGPKGTVEIASDFERARLNPNIIGAVFCIESAGGMALAVKPLADAMKLFREDKPIIALTGSVVASGGYYLAVYADEIMSDHPRSIIGSIGAMMAFTDVKGALEKQGIRFHEIYATQSTLKNKTFNEALNGNYDPLIKNMLDPINSDFIADVKEQRSGVISAKKEIFAGETFMATIAKDLGMIDSFGNLSDAVSRVEELSKVPRLKFSQITKPIDMKFANLAALAANSTPTVEQIDLANADLTTEGITGVTLVAESFINEAASVTSENKRLTSELATANTSLQSAASERDLSNASLATANARISELETKLSKLPGADHNQQAGAAADEPPAGDDSVEAIMANLPHNKRAAESGF